MQNIGAVSFLMAAVMMRRGELLKVGLADRIHVPYRLPLISGAEEAMKMLIKRMLRCNNKRIRSDDYCFLFSGESI